MRAGGLWAGAAVLVATWCAWFVGTDVDVMRRTAMQAVARRAAGQVPTRRGAVSNDTSSAVNRGSAANVGLGEAIPRGLRPVPIFAEVANGRPLTTFLAEHNLAGAAVSLALFAGEPARQPAAVTLLGASWSASPRFLGVLSAGEASALHREEAPGLLAPIAAPPSGAWVALLVDGVLLGVGAMEVESGAVRFELAPDDVLRRLRASLS